MQLLGSTISRSSYANIERGDRNIKVTDIVTLQKIYNINYSEFYILNTIRHCYSWVFLFCNQELYHR